MYAGYTLLHPMMKKEEVTVLISDIGSTYCRLYLVRYTGNLCMKLLSQASTTDVSGGVIDEVLMEMCRDTIDDDANSYNDKEKKVVYEGLVREKKHLSDNRTYWLS